MERARAEVFIATSLDGFIAREDGAIDWLEAAHARLPPGEDCGYQSFFDRVDALIIGRRTFEQVLRFAQWPYVKKPVVVLSRGSVAVPAGLQAMVTATANAPSQVLRNLGARGIARAYVDGGLTIQSFLIEGLVDEITITAVPVLLGRGRPLFAALPADQWLQLVQVRHWEFGFVQSRYRVQAGAGAAVGHAGRAPSSSQSL